MCDWFAAIDGEEDVGLPCERSHLLEPAISFDFRSSNTAIWPRRRPNLKPAAASSPIKNTKSAIGERTLSVRQREEIQEVRRRMNT